MDDKQVRDSGLDIDRLEASDLKTYLEQNREDVYLPGLVFQLVKEVNELRKLRQ